MVGQCVRAERKRDWVRTLVAIDLFCTHARDASRLGRRHPPAPPVPAVSYAQPTTAPLRLLPPSPRRGRAGLSAGRGDGEVVELSAARSWLLWTRQEERGGPAIRGAAPAPPLAPDLKLQCSPRLSWFRICPPAVHRLPPRPPWERRGPH